LSVNKLRRTRSRSLIPMFDLAPWESSIIYTVVSVWDLLSIQAYLTHAERSNFRCRKTEYRI
jgi:hypothetical protein